MIPTFCHDHVILTLILILILTHPLFSIKLLNIFHPKILHAPFSISDLPCINLDITSYTSALTVSEKKVLPVLQNRGQATYLMPGLQEKTTYRSVSFLSNAGRMRDSL